MSTEVGDIYVDLSFEEVGSSNVLGLAHYYAEADNTDGSYGTAGWHQAYQNRDGTLEWDNSAAVTGDPYGKDANCVYRVFRVKVVPHSSEYTAEQYANNPEKHTVGGKVTIADNCDGQSSRPDHNCAMIWSKSSAIAHRGAASGYPEAPGNDLGTTALAFADIDLSSWFDGTNNTKAAKYSTTYFAVMIDGAVHTANTNVTATLGWNSVTIK